MSLDHLLQEYRCPDGIWDEMCGVDHIREHYQKVFSSLRQLDVNALVQKDRLAAELFMNQGITFTVYSDNQGIERIFPFDIIPRIIPGSEWDHIESGIGQRLKALNLFLKDVYHEQNIIRDRIIPAGLVASCPHYTREAFGIKVPHDIYVHISGIDLIRGQDGRFLVLEDNLRTPSGVSYMLENREVTKRIFPHLLTDSHVRRVSNYPLLLHEILLQLAPTQVSDPTIVLLTPGVFNSAYYEHTFLARQMGISLVEGRDLTVDNHKVYMKTTNGLERVHVIYRRIDDEFLDPLVFRPDSALGVPGLMSAYRKGNVAIVNAIGNGVADDKAVYAYVPDMIRYYLNEEPILPNVPTYQLSDPDARAYVFDHIQGMVVKRTNQSGGYGMVMGNKVTDGEWAKARLEIEKESRNFIAQPIIPLSTVPCFIDGEFRPRHVDLRPYALYGPQGVKIVPGGLTRVALKEGSLVVNSSQGGGSKDTWVTDQFGTHA
ncbi:circularly permuted type 2 ATP-grasp protein [Dinghuibacter silviterrae]|uniref:Putative circularly permuted ATP-grasp superfamily protein n=1 Tax=Dinghuibacter silviterrae TaxID=1539049 RepID=A0A4R8DP11_9BACT|nr:circularly permuted type 2 ATP-grasp protein [Dinghuibacter silviterrae]TDW99801.1 putative circularly permuted ATP-grasp superfamily protein [Dinghuibacter silviterrae]